MMITEWRVFIEAQNGTKNMLGKRMCILRTKRSCESKYPIAEKLKGSTVNFFFPPLLLWF